MINYFDSADSPTIWLFLFSGYFPTAAPVSVLVLSGLVVWYFKILYLALISCELGLVKVEKYWALIGRLLSYCPRLSPDWLWRLLQPGYDVCVMLLRCILR